ncbi:MAG: hypothetical protein ACRC7V_10420 [Lachnospiraceae bacterium]
MGIASIGSSIVNQFISSNSNGTPNWNYIPTCSVSEKSQKEFEVEIQNLAKKAASTSDKAELEKINKQVLKIRTEYISSVSPDRKQLYSSASSTMAKDSGKNYKCKGIGELSLLDFLEESKDNMSERMIAISGGQLSFAISSYGGYDVMISAGGQQVLGTANGQWTYQMTGAELQKKDEFYAIYWKSYRNEKTNEKELSELPDYIDNKSILDLKA